MNKSELKRFLRSIKLRLSEIVAAVDIRLINIFALNGFFASVYYCFINPAFYREHLSVLRGRLRYARSLREIENSSALLRRNTHRLEKGLIMQPRRAIFASAYIGETVGCYQRCVDSGTVESAEMKWAGDVLLEYFSVVGDSDKKVDAARRQFESIKCLVLTNQACCGKSKPYTHQELPEVSVEYDGLLTLFKRRRSVRWYQDQPVARELINQAVDAASLAPSACNRQPYRFVFFDDPDDVQEVASFAMGTAGFNHQLPTLFAVVGDLSCYPKERDRHVIYIDASLASMQLMLALETLGLSSCPINWPDIESRERKIAKRLNLGAHERVVMLIAAGYAMAAGGVPFSQKKCAQVLLSAT